MKHMLNYICKYNNIIVTGAQRSGTKIASRIIAHEAKYRWVPEEEIACRSMTKLFGFILSPENVVIQCPALSQICHLIDAPSTLIVFMKRELKDIVSSQNRIKWTEKEQTIELANYFLEDGQISEVKYSTWEKYQKPNIKTYLELKYEDLSGHHMWVENRINFADNQTA